MTPGTLSLSKFVLRTILWLPLCFAAWYFSAPYHAAIVGDLARSLVNTIQHGLVSELEQPAVDLVFVTTVKVHPEPGLTGFLVPEVNPLLYTYGLPFFIALMLAASARWWKLLVGAVVLLPVQSWGVAFDFLVQVGVQLGPDIAKQAGFSGWRREAIALGYQIGYLIFPSLVPVVLWAIFNWRFVESVLESKFPVKGEGKKTKRRR